MGIEVSMAVSRTKGRLCYDRVSLPRRAAIKDERGYGTPMALSSDTFETRTLASPDGLLEATFAPRAGMVGCSLRHMGEELLHQGGGLEAYARNGKTFGIPLLYPWANRLAGFGFEFDGRTVTLERSSALLQHDDNGLPIHGLLTASPYWSERVSTNAHEARLEAELDFGAHPELLAAFPFSHRLSLAVRLAEAELEIATTVTAASDPVPVSFGFHPYFQIPGAPREQWEIELPVTEQLVLDERMIPTGERRPFHYEPGPLGDLSFDDGYARLEPGRPFAVSGAGRRIEVRFGERFPFAQVYSPPGAQFICFEPMTAPTNALRSGDGLPVVRPGESFTARWKIRVEQS
jgi:aldose 1-epimerase